MSYLITNTLKNKQKLIKNCFYLQWVSEMMHKIYDDGEWYGYYL